MSLSACDMLDKRNNFMLKGYEISIEDVYSP